MTFFLSAYNGQGWPVFNREEDCSYLFDWDTKYACLDHPVIEECRVNHEGKRFDLSPLVKHTGIYVIDIYTIIVLIITKQFWIQGLHFDVHM